MRRDLWGDEAEFGADGGELWRQGRVFQADRGIDDQDGVGRGTRIRPRWIGCVSEPIGLDTVLAFGGGDRRRARGQSETVENFPSRVGRVNGGEDSQAFVAAGTFEHVQGPGIVFILHLPQ